MQSLGGFFEDGGEALGVYGLVIHVAFRVPAVGKKIQDTGSLEASKFRGFLARPAGHQPCEYALA